MNKTNKIFEKIQTLTEKNRKYKFEAYTFILAALHDTMKKIYPPRHITGKEFCEGIRKYALEQFGPMAKTLLEFWGIKTTTDFGRIVFDLVDVGLMRKTEEDSIEDFRNIYSFKKAFHPKLAFEAT